MGMYRVSNARFQLNIIIIIILAKMIIKWKVFLVKGFLLK